MTNSVNSSSLSPEFVAAVGGHPVVAEVLWRRGIRSIDAAQAFLNPDRYAPAPPHDLPDLDAAVARLMQAINNHERIRVWGDFDVDGQTSTSVLLLGLRMCGATVDYIIPHRLTQSHGLNFEGIRKAHEEGITVLLTCDCGVTDFEAVRYARQLGLDVLISDHHDLEHDASGQVLLPEATAIINPKRLPPNHPLIHLPGVGVAYQLMLALIKIAPKVASTASQSLLDLVALGIVADIAYQRDDTRYLLQRGLQQLRQSPRPGIRALMRAADIVPASFDADSIGYQIGPRLNAAGRMETADLSVQLLTAESDADAQALADRIEQLNNDRKRSQRLMEEQALAQLNEHPELARYEVIVLNSPDWSASVIGVVANGIVDRYHRPAILISARPGEIGRASARSVPGIDIHAAIAAQEQLIESGGGHPMAAGFAIRAENIEAFRTAVSAHVRQQITHAASTAADPSSEAPLLDEAFEVAWRDVSLELNDQIDRLAPFGSGNPRPQLMSRDLTFVRAEAIGQDGRHQLLYLQDQSGYLARAAWWRSTGRPMPAPNAPVSLVFGLRRNIYQGRVRLQIEVVELQFDKTVAAPVAVPTESPSSNGAATAGAATASAAPASAAPAATVASRFRIIDLRGELDRAAALQRLSDEHGAVQVWAEEINSHSQATGQWHTRVQLAPSSVLVIWTAPPSTAVLQQALASAQPQTVVLLCHSDHAADNVEGFTGLMAQMLKLSQARGDALDDPTIIARMAARIGQRPESVREAIACWQINPGDGAVVASAHLRFLLDETRAYRRYFCEAGADAVLRTSA